MVMKKKTQSVVRMPDNLKSDPAESSEVKVGDYGAFKGISATWSTTWLAFGSSLLGYQFIPGSFIAIPITLSVLAGLGFLFTGIGFFAEQLPSNISYELSGRHGLNKKLKDISAWTMKNEGVPVSSWTRSVGMGIVQFFLPFRIFKRVKMYESITYYPYNDIYVKETRYLGFRSWVSEKKTFRGHRAAFRKAVDSF